MLHQPLADLLRQHIEKIMPLTEEEFGFIRSHFTFKKFR
jgi:hypothetical protein